MIDGSSGTHPIILPLILSMLMTIVLVTQSDRAMEAYRAILLGHDFVETRVFHKSPIEF